LWLRCRVWLIFCGLQEVHGSFASRELFTNQKIP
jgi:hypothetical protein